MPTTRIREDHRGGPARLVAMSIITATLVIVTLGCCDVICPPPVPPATHSIAFGVDTDRCPCPDAKCVCPVPTVIKVRRGDKVQFVNASPHEVTVIPSDTFTFVEGSPVVIAAGKTAQVTVSSNAPSPGVSLDMIVTSPGTLCPGLPGPRMDIDD